MKRTKNGVQAAKWVAVFVGVALLNEADDVLLAQSGTSLDSSPSAKPVSTNINSPAPIFVTNTPATNASNAASAGPTKIEGDYLEIGFAKLSAFPVRVIYETVDPATLAYAPKILGEIPSTVRALDAQKVAVKGFMLPLKQADGYVTEFLLLKDQSMCCYGLSPKANEWVQVQMKGRGVRSIMDKLVIIYGTLHVGEFQQSQQMAGIYRLDGDKLIKTMP